MRDDREKLLDIMEAIECIEKYALKGRDTFQRDEMERFAIFKLLGIMGGIII